MSKRKFTIEVDEYKVDRVKYFVKVEASSIKYARNIATRIVENRVAKPDARITDAIGYQQETSRHAMISCPCTYREGPRDYNGKRCPSCGDEYGEVVR